jgi:NAD+ kinase
MSKPKRYEKIAFVASAGVEAQAALADLTKLYGNCDPGDADIVVALGGDGLMLCARGSRSTACTAARSASS